MGRPALDLELRKRRIEGSHRTDYCTQPQDRGTIPRSFDTDCNYTESTGRGMIHRSFDTDCNYTESTDTGSSYTDSIDTASIRHIHIDT